MGLLTSQGSLGSTILPSGNEYVDQPIPVAVTADNQVMDRPFVADARSYKNILSNDRDHGIIEALKGYLTGSPIKVTFFKRISTNAASVSQNTDVTLTLASDDAFMQINNFEMRLVDQMQYNYDPDTNVSQYLGQAITYPMFNSSAGDIFLYQLEATKLGLFKINKAPDRLSIRSSTCYRIDFELIRFVDEADLEVLRAHVAKIMYFDTRRFFDGRATLLESREYQMLNAIQHNLPLMKQHYIRNFFNYDTAGTFIHPDGYLDPYLIDFVQKTIDFYPWITAIQLPLQRFLYDRTAATIWDRLLSPDSFTAAMSEEYFSLYKNIPYTQDTIISQWIGRSYLCTCPETEINAREYVVTGSTSIELVELVTMYLNEQKLDLNLLMSQINNCINWDKPQQFYWIPIIMYLSNLATNTILYGSGMTEESVPMKTLPTEIPFDQSNLMADTATLVWTVSSNHVLGVIDHNRVYRPFVKDEVVYDGDGDVTLDLTRIFADAEITYATFTGTWKLVLTGATEPLL